MDVTEEKARYVGEAGNALTDGTVLVPGETIAVVSKGEAEASEIWEPVTDGVPASDRPRNSPPLTPAPRPVVPDDGDDE